MAVSFTPITSIQEIETEWRSVLQESPADTLFLTPQWQKVWWDIFGEGHTMCGFAYSANGKVVGIASLAKSGETISFVGSQDTFDYNDFPIQQGYEKSFYQTLLECMDGQDFQNIHLFSFIDYIPV